MNGVFFVTEETDVMFQEKNLRICGVADGDRSLPALKWMVFLGVFMA